MATSKITLDEGTTTNTATNTISEDAVTKHLARVVINNSSGTEVSPATEATLGSIKTAVEIMDDWDETNRAAVNPIAGQVGVQGASGIVTALTQRVVLATDVALPAGTNAIGKLAANDGIDIGDVDITSVIPGTGTSNLGKAEDGIHVTGDVGVMALGVRQAANAPLSGADGDYEPLQTDANGHLKVNIIDALPAGTNGIGKLTANSGVDIGDVDILSIAAGDNNIGNVDIVTVPAPLSTTGGGTEATALRVTLASDGTGLVSVDDNGGSLTVDGTLTINGDVAHDGIDSGNPVKVGGQARQTNPAAVADADRVNAIYDDIGRQVITGSIRDLKVNQQTTITSSTSETTIVTAGAAGVFHDLYGLIISNTSATGLSVTIKDATAGTTRFIIYVPATDTRGFMLPESAGHNQAAAANNWTATCSASVASVQITALCVKNV